MSTDAYRMKLDKAASDVMTEFLATATHQTNPRPWTNREIMLLLREAVLKGADITLSELSPSKEQT